MTNSDDLFVFSDEEEQDIPAGESVIEEKHYLSSLPPWKILVVDDEEDIHRTTRLVLGGFTFRGRGIELFHAHSGAEAHDLLKQHEDVALVLLDVVMESDDAGLQLAQTIRYEMNNSCIQIILRTGQPGVAPEQEVMTRYEINDYKAKTELTAAKLHTSICTGLRAFELANSLNETINHLEVELENRRKAEAELVTHKEHLEELVTERTGALQDAHDKLKLQQQQIVYAEKMAGIGQLAAGVAHEINNPIAFIQANLGAMGEYVGVFKALLTEYEELRTLTEKEQLVATTIHRIAELRREEDVDYMVEDIDCLLLDSVHGAARVQEIVQNLKSFAKLNEGDQRTANINDCIRETLAVLSSDLAPLEVIAELNDLPEIMCSPRDLNQVFLAVLRNALDAVDTDGRIDITTECSNEKILVKISDNGIGIPEGDLQRLFDPFFTTKEVGTGTGLGLSIAHGIIEKHNGKIGIQSLPKKGAIVTIELPLEKNLKPPPQETE